MANNSIIEGLSRHAEQALSDLHLLFTNDVESVDLPYYNAVYMAVDNFKKALDVANENHKEHIKKITAQYNTTQINLKS